MRDDTISLEQLRRGRKAALARALAALERKSQAPEVRALLDAAYRAPKAHVVGITGPPGVGKSTLLGALIAAFRQPGPKARSVGVIAVDPSSRRSGGALLGDRVRLLTDPEDEGVFVRSMAARDRLGGVADMTFPAMVLMRALFDLVLVETVGVGQSETDVAGIADSVVFCVQPGSGDSLQFMKAGIIEIPHIALVTKADMAGEARRTLADLRGALSLAETEQEGWPVEVLSVAAARKEGIAELIALLDRHRDWLGAAGRLTAARRGQAEAWLEEWLRERFGSDGLARLGQIDLAPEDSPFARAADYAGTLSPGSPDPSDP
jgi:LAO/AO transport system kinase